MRLKNNPDVHTIRQSEKFRLRPDVEIEIQSLPPDYDDTVEIELPAPEATRLGIEKDGKGKAVLDDQGRTVMRYDTEDADYKRAVTRHGKLQAIKILVDGIAPGQIDFEATLGEDAPAYYQAVLQELKAFGFGLGDVLSVVKAVSDLSGISDEDMRAAEADFTEAES